MATVITQTANPAGVSASATVATYTGVSIGTAAPNRIVVVLVGSELASTPIASCTIGGNAMTAGTQGNQGAVYARAFYLLYPTGTTANIAVTFTTNSPTSTQNHIAVYSVVGGTYSSTGADQSTDMDSTDPLTTGSISIASGGGFIAVVASATDTNAKTWANATEDIDADGGALRFTTATRTTALTTTAVTCTGTTNGEDGAMSWIIFGANTSPTVALNSPADAASTGDLTPTLNFTGTDTNSDEVEYHVQVDTATFSSTVVTNLTSGFSDTDATSYNTASVSPSSNYLNLVSVTNVKSSTPDTPTLSGNGITYEQIDTHVIDSVGTMRRSTLFRSLGSSPSSGAITIDFGGNTQTACSWVVDTVSGVDTSGTNGSGAIVQSAKTTQDNTGNTTSLTATLSSFSSANNLTYGVYGGASTTGLTAGSGFTILASASSTTPTSDVATEWKSTNDTTVDFSFDANDAIGVIALEIKARAPLIDALSSTDAGFTAGHPFASGVAKDYLAGYNKITATNLTSGYDTDGNSTASTSSVSPSANKLLLLTVVSRTAITADPNQPTVTGNGLTWIAVDSLLWDTSSSSRKKTTVFRAMGSSPSTGAISIDFGGQNQTHVSWGLEEFTGIDTSGTSGSGAIVQTAKGYDDTTEQASFTVTLGAFSNINNATFGAWGCGDDTSPTTAGAGFTKYSDVTISGAGDPRLTTEFKNSNDTSVDISWAGTVLEKGGIAIEIKAGEIPLIDSTTYYWRVRAIDPAGSNSYGAWATTRSFVATAGGGTIVQDLIGGGFIPFAR